MNASSMIGNSIHSTAIVIPTYNAGKEFETLLKQINTQTLLPTYKLIIDSDSTDQTAESAETAGWQVVSISHNEFSHGGTRQQAVELLSALKNPPDIIIFLTQDVRMPQKDCLEKLIQAFENTDIAAAYGRQRPHKGAGIFATLDREFNYPSENHVKSTADIKKMGIKTVFFSDSFAAYRVKTLQQIGGFPSVNICEDVYIAGKLILSGHKIAYIAEAEVCHSHEPQPVNLWKRYRKIGRFYRNNPWIEQNFGTTGREGIRLICYQIKIIWKKKGLAGVAKILFINSIKLLAYKCPY